MKYRVHVTGVVETSSWYEVEAENEEQAEELACLAAETEGYVDPEANLVHVKSDK